MTLIPRNTTMTSLERVSITVTWKIVEKIYFMYLVFDLGPS